MPLKVPLALRDTSRSLEDGMNPASGSAGVSSVPPGTRVPSLHSAAQAITIERSTFASRSAFSTIASPSRVVPP